MPIPDLHARVDSFVSDLYELIQAEALNTVRRALGEGEIPVPYSPGEGRRRGRPTGKKRGRPVGSGKRGRPGGKGKRIRRSAEDLEAMAASIHQFVHSNPGLGSEAISQGVGISSKDIKMPMRMLLASGKLRMEGQKRGATYHAGAGRGAKKKRGAKKAGKRRGGKKRGRKTGRKATSRKVA